MGRRAQRSLLLPRTEPSLKLLHESSKRLSTSARHRAVKSLGRPSRGPQGHWVIRRRKTEAGHSALHCRAPCLDHASPRSSAGEASAWSGFVLKDGLRGQYTVHQARKGPRGTSGGFQGHEGPDLGAWPFGGLLSGTVTLAFRAPRLEPTGEAVGGRLKPQFSFDAVNYTVRISHSYNLKCSLENFYFLPCFWNEVSRKKKMHEHV